ncbi:MAG: VCBS repeat-containing protein [Flavobacteriales bacterium]|nr:VCBS repeat-containing protein [Flavobacteriales bacterium]
MKKLLFILFSLLSLYGFGQFSGINEIIPSINEPSDAEVADFDGDGDLDIFYVSTQDHKVAWIENLGSGKFSLQKFISTNFMGAKCIALTDVDGDFDLDVVAGATFSAGPKIAWFENLGNGLFDTTKNIIPSNLYTVHSIHAADIDNDGDFDILSASYTDDKIDLFENLGSGSFNTQTTISTIMDGANIVSTSDLDNDGDADIIASAYNGAEIVWFENLGSGLIDTTKNVIASPYGASAIFTVDINVDGNIDILASGISPLNIKASRFDNLGAGTFGPEQILHSRPGPSASKFIYSEDMDGDADKDIIYAFTVPNEIFWQENLGGGVMDTTINLINNSYCSDLVCLLAADLDGDLDNDVLSFDRNLDFIYWNKNDGVGNFNKTDLLTKAIYLHKAIDVDVDNDNDIDIITYGAHTNTLLWAENTGNEHFENHHIIKTGIDGVQDIAKSDIDIDGNIDIIVANWDSIILFRNFGGAFDTIGSFIPPAIGNVKFIQTCDIDNDMDDDLIIVEDIGTPTVYWFENIGGGVFDTTMNLINNNYTISDNVSSVFTIDMDNDLDKDIVLSISKRAVWHENIGGIIDSNENLIGIMPDNMKLSRIVDLDNDNDLDLVCFDYSNNLSWFENLGGNIFDSVSTEIQVIGGLITSDMNLLDIDSDGDKDIITTRTNKIYWHENLLDTLDTIISSQYIINSVGGSSFEYLKLVDLENDGDDDLMIIGDNNDIFWFENYSINPRVSGSCYIDLNQNKKMDSNEVGIPNIQTKILPNSKLAYSDVNGDYYYLVDTGSYTVSYYPFQYWNLITDSSSYNVTLSSLNGLIDSLDFGFYPDTALTVLNPDLAGAFPRCNDTINYWASIQNEGTTIPSGTIHLQLDDSITFVSAAIAPDSIIGQHIYWHYDSLFFFSSEVINMQVQLPDFHSMGDTLISFLTVTQLDSLGSTSIIYSNTDTMEQVLVCAYDPNDKSVSPTGWGVEGFIDPYQELEYLIRFQNTGNDTAITVMVRDQLDENLNWGTMQPIASSHPMQAWIEQDGEAVFKFQNIMLPDSGADFLGSQGFVKFRIQPDSGLAPLTPIYNTSHIYFDFNPAVVTNTVLNTIECYTAPLSTINYSFPYLYANPTGNYSYQWYFNDTLIAGATSDTLLPLTSGDYTVEITDSNTCFKKSLPYNYLIIGTDQYETIQSVIFPNPFHEGTSFLFDRNLNGEFDLVICNILGAEVKRISKINGNRVELHKNDIGKGLFLSYLINHQTGERMFLEKLVVQ